MAEQQKQGKNHCLIRSAKNRDKGVFKRQELITTRNKAGHVAMNTCQGDPYAGISMKVSEHKGSYLHGRWQFRDVVVIDPVTDRAVIQKVWTRTT